jgi:RNA polymerase sigma-70 factor (ECF subfamily)
MTGSITSKDLFHNVENIVEELPSRRREIFTLRQIKGLSYKEISKELNISVKTVEHNINLAIKYIKDRISKNFILILPGISFFL